MTIFTKALEEFESWHSSLNEIYEDEDVCCFNKHVLVRVGYLGLAIVGVIIGPAIVAINTVAYAFNLLTLGYIEPLENFLSKISPVSMTLLLMIFVDVMATINPGTVRHLGDEYKCIAEKVNKAGDYMDSLWEDPKSSTFSKQVIVRLGNLGVSLLAGVTAVVTLAFAIEAFAFNIITGGCIGDLDEFFKGTLGSGVRCMQLSLGSVNNLIRPHK